MIKMNVIERREAETLSWPALLAIVIWGFSFIAIKTALREVHPFTLLTLRFGMGGLLLLLFQLQKDKRFINKFSCRDWLSIIFLALVGISGHSLLQAYGLLYTTAINTGWIIAIVPIFIIIAAHFYLDEPITIRKVGGIILGLIGVALVISKGVFSLSRYFIFPQHFRIFVPQRRFLKLSSSSRMKLTSALRDDHLCSVAK